MNLLDFIAAYGPWVWILAGVVLLAFELAIPGGFFLWMGVSGIVTGLASMFQPIAWPWQVLIFGALSLVTISGWLRYWRRHEQPSDRPLLNERAAQFVGQEAMLAEPIRGGFGRIVFGDTTWRVAGPDLAAGERVRIVGYEGGVLRVEAA